MHTYSTRALQHHTESQTNQHTVTLPLYLQMQHTSYLIIKLCLEAHLSLQKGVDGKPHTETV